MALKIVKGNIERMFDKNLTDLVRGIRNNKENEVGWQPARSVYCTGSKVRFVTKCYCFPEQIHLAMHGRHQIRASAGQYFRQKQCYRKTNLCKLIDMCQKLFIYILVYVFQLQMLGYDISWAGFNIIEVMSSNKFTFKRIGYLSASQSFHCDSEVCKHHQNK